MYSAKNVQSQTQPSSLESQMIKGLQLYNWIPDGLWRLDTEAQKRVFQAALIYCRIDIMRYFERFEYTSVLSSPVTLEFIDKFVPNVASGSWIKAEHVDYLEYLSGLSADLRVHIIEAIKKLPLSCVINLENREDLFKRFPGVGQHFQSQLDLSATELQTWIAGIKNNDISSLGTDSSQFKLTSVQQSYLLLFAVRLNRKDILVKLLLNLNFPTFNLFPDSGLDQWLKQPADATLLIKDSIGILDRSLIFQLVMMAVHLDDVDMLEYLHKQLNFPLKPNGYRYEKELCSWESSVTYDEETNERHEGRRSYGIDPKDVTLSRCALMHASANQKLNTLGWLLSNDTFCLTEVHSPEILACQYRDAFNYIQRMAESRQALNVFLCTRWKSETSALSDFELMHVASKVYPERLGECALVAMDRSLSSFLFLLKETYITRWEKLLYVTPDSPDTLRILKYYSDNKQAVCSIGVGAAKPPYKAFDEIIKLRPLLEKLKLNLALSDEEMTILREKLNPKNEANQTRCRPSGECPKVELTPLRWAVMQLICAQDNLSLFKQLFGSNDLNLIKIALLAGARKIFNSLMEDNLSQYKRDVDELTSECRNLLTYRDERRIPLVIDYLPMHIEVREPFSIEALNDCLNTLIPESSQILIRLQDGSVHPARLFSKPFKGLPLQMAVLSRGQ